MKPEVNIRIASLDDAILLADLGRTTFYDAFANHPEMPKADLGIYLSEAFSDLQIHHELNDPRASFLLAEIKDQPVGYAKLIHGISERDVAGKNPVKLKRLYARQEFIGAGVGAALLSHSMDMARKNEHDTIWLTVWEHNQKAQNFYRKWGFEPCGFVDFHFGNIVLTDILMQRSLI